MNKLDGREKLKKLYDDLESLQFPSFTNQDELDDWLEDLIEVDAHYAGLANSVAAGNSCFKKQLIDIGSLKNKFITIISHQLNSKENICQISNYLNKIEEIDSILRKIAL